MTDASRTMTISRRFRASPAEVYAAWTTPAALGQWFGPAGWICETEAMDPRVGGEWRFTMRGDGMAFPNRHRWTALEPHGRIAFLMDGGDDAEEPMVVEVRLVPEGSGTRLTQTVTFPSAAALAEARAREAEAKGAETLGKLADHLGE